MGRGRWDGVDIYTKMKLFNKLILIGNILLILLTLGAYLAAYIPPSKSSLIAILGLGYPALLMTNIACILYWLLFKPKWALLSFLVLLLGFNHIFGLFGINNSKQAKTNTPTVNIASFNMQFSKPIRHGNKAHKKTMDKRFRKYMHQFQDIDILCLQEHSGFAEARIKKELDLPFKHNSDRNYEAIYSKYPIINTGSLENFSKNRALSCIWTDIAIQKDTIRVYSVHMEANQKDGIIPKKVIETAKEEPVSSSMAFGLLKHYQNFSIKRVVQAKKIREHQKNSPYPSILCGDMNDTPQTYVYRILANGQQDTFWEKGRGLGVTFGSTFKNKLACLRIDYIFADSTFEVLKHQIFPDIFSDHYLIQSEIQL